MRNLYGFDDENRIGEGRRPKFNLTCAVEFPILLKVVPRSGIFFKALANFQWDRLLKTDIISKEYLEGCYKLGQQYPDLCSSIFLMCERGEKR